VQIIRITREVGAGEGARTPACSVQNANAFRNLRMVTNSYHRAASSGSRYRSGNTVSGFDLLVISPLCEIGMRDQEELSPSGPTPKKGMPRRSCVQSRGEDAAF
jgi:hypothetical protein